MIYWLASYPRSGNTWCRAFLTNLMQGAGEPPADIHRLAAPPTPISRDAFNSYLDVASSDLTPGEIERLRRQLYLRLGSDAPEPLILKLHCAYRVADDGLPIFPREATAGVVLIVRNPLDVAVSMAPFFDIGLDAAVAMMANEDAELGGQSTGAGPGLPQRIGSWSGHTRSWLDAGLPLHLVRYEDLVADAAAAFMALARFLGFAPEPAMLAAAIDRSRFEALREQEDARPDFTLRPRGAARFFRSGRTGAWREALSAAQRETLVRAHGPVMRRLGYGQAAA